MAQTGGDEQQLDWPEPPASRPAAAAAAAAATGASVHFASANGDGTTTDPAAAPPPPPRAKLPPLPPIGTTVRDRPPLLRKTTAWRLGDLANVQLTTALFWIAIVLAVSACGLKLAAHRQDIATWWRIGGMRPPEVYAMGSVLPSKKCIAVTPEEIINGTAQGGQIDLRNMRATLIHHMTYGGENKKPLQGFCAQYLDRFRICYCIVNMVRRADEPQNWVEMYNMKIIGTSPALLVQNTEKSILCANAVTAVRYEEISIAWHTPEGVLRNREVSDLAAQTLQQLDVMQRGRGSCEDSNIEAQISMLRQDWMESNARIMYNDPAAIAAIAPGSHYQPHAGPAHSLRLPGGGTGG